ncbi:MAG: hypothetical protein J7M34_09745 [Anaerolineae bacterium]|nr:hypothetical protein [Anaerolineae bacterium]
MDIKRMAPRRDGVVLPSLATLNGPSAADVGRHHHSAMGTRPQAGAPYRIWENGEWNHYALFALAPVAADLLLRELYAIFTSLAGGHWFTYAGA